MTSRQSVDVPSLSRGACPSSRVRSFVQSRNAHFKTMKDRYTLSLTKRTSLKQASLLTAKRFATSSPQGRHRQVVGAAPRFGRADVSRPAQHADGRADGALPAGAALLARGADVSGHGLPGRDDHRRRDAERGGRLLCAQRKEVRGGSPDVTVIETFILDDWTVFRAKHLAPFGSDFCRASFCVSNETKSEVCRRTSDSFWITGPPFVPNSCPKCHLGLRPFVSLVGRPFISSFCTLGRVDRPQSRNSLLFLFL